MTIPSGWSLSTLGEISEKPQYGWTTKATTREGALKFVRTTDISGGCLDWASVPYCTEVPDARERYTLQDGDILISRSGSVGISYLVREPEPAVFASYLIRFRLRDEINKSYVRYFLQSPAYWRQVREKASGNTLSNINAKKLQSIALPVAPAEQQAPIVEEIEKQFTRLDAAVGALHRTRANLNRYRASNLSQFVTCATVSSGGDTPFENLWATAGYGTSVKCSYEYTGVPVLRIPNIRDGMLDLEFLKHAHSSDEVDKLLLKENDLVFIRTNGSKKLIGRTAPVRVNLNIAFASYLIRIGIRKEDASARYLSTLFEAPSYRRELQEMAASTSGQYNVSLSKLRHLRVPVPPLETQLELLQDLDQCLSVSTSVAAQLGVDELRAAHLRQSILARAFSGQLVQKR